MTNRNGAKGSAFERLIADCLALWVDERIDRRVKTGAKDKGDIANLRLGGVPRGRIVVECKNVKTMNLSGWVDEADIERGNDDALLGVVIHKRRGHGQPLDQYVSMTVRDLIALLTGERPD